MVFIKRRSSFKLIILLSLLIFFSLISLSFGQIDVSFNHILNIIMYNLGLSSIDSNWFTQEELAIIWYIRLPRLIIGILVGAALGIAGATMQGIFGNPLADPGIVGVSAGAAVGAVISMALGLSVYNIFVMPAFAFLGSIIAVFITVFLAMRNGKIPVMTLLLAGVAVGMLFGAVTSGLLTIMNQQQLQQYLFWMVGGLDFRRWEHVYMSLPIIVIGIAILLILARHLNILALGESYAKAVGMSVMPFRITFLAIASMITASAVCVSGNIGFVGLVIPHMMRIIFGPDHRILLPASALGGALFLALSDFIGRTLFYSIEIRVGIITALLGTPYFLYLLRKARKSVIG